MKHAALLKKVGEDCRRARLMARISVNYMAGATGYRPSTITQFEQGNNNNLYLYLKYKEVIDHAESTKSGTDHE